MHIFDFTANHIEQAAQIAKQNYGEERGHVPALPPADFVPDLMLSAKNGLGVAAFEGSTMLGFLCAAAPLKNAFGSTNAVGVFSPLGANGSIGDDRENIYAHMYQAAGEKWRHAGASNHAVCLYAHDKKVQEQLFRYGFGLRCIDAIRGMDPIDFVPCKDFDFVELHPEEFLQILPLEHMLDAHMAESPVFIVRPSDTKDSFIRKTERRSIFFAAQYKGQIAAYIRAERDGETFIQDMPGYFHVTGAFCLPEHRGKQLNQTLLSLLVQKLRILGYTRLGVDFESINPSAYGFWLKYFTAYTHSVVRRIDEHAISG